MKSTGLNPGGPILEPLCLTTLHLHVPPLASEFVK